MIKSKGIFAVSFIAMMVVGGAYANIASQGYVDQEVGKRLSTVNTTGTGDVVTAVSANNETGVVTVERGKTMPTKTSDLTNDSGFITAAALPEEYTLPAATATALGGVKSGGDITVAADGAVTVNSATTADSATKATQDAAGNVIADTYATKAEIPDEITVDAALSDDSTNPVQNKVVKVALDAKADSAELDNVLKNTATDTSDGSVATAGALGAVGGALAIGTRAAGAGALSVVVGGDAVASADANASVVVGNGAKALSGASSSVAVGLGAETKGTGAVSVGWGTGAVNNATAVGADSEVTGPLGVAVGSTSKATGERSVAVGSNSTADGDYAIQLGAGQNTNAGTFNVGLGSGKNYQLLDENGTIPAERMPDTVLTNTATGTGSFATGGGDAGNYASATVIGVNAKATGGGGTAIGTVASAVQNAVALGANARGDGLNSVALGTSSSVTGENSIGIGNGSGASGNDAVVIGVSAFTRGANNVVVGNEAGAGGTYSVSLGFGASSNAENAIQIGTGFNADSGTLSVGFGDSGNYKLLDSSGKIPGERLQISVGDPEGSGGYADIWIE